MKQPPKPFAIEIKRSRRALAPASPADLFDKESSTLNGGFAGVFSKRDSFSEATSDFAVPAFLQTDKAAHRTASSQLLKEAAEVFRPKPAAPASEGAPSETRAPPRILPSLVPMTSPGQDREPDADSPARAARRVRKLDAPLPKPRAAARTERAETGEARAKRFSDDGAPAAAASRTKRNGADGRAGGGRADKGAEAAPSHAADHAVESSAATNPGGNWRGVRARSLTRRSRADAAALPPGQHWKRRLNPRAW